jgi:hypothetical protein
MSPPAVNSSAASCGVLMAPLSFSNPDKPEKILHHKDAKVAKFFRKQFPFNRISLSFATLASLW